MVTGARQNRQTDRRKSSSLKGPSQSHHLRRGL